MKDQSVDTLATVDPIVSDNSINWSAKAVAGDVLQRVDHANPLLCVWLNSNNEVKWSKTNTDFKTLSMFAAFTLELAQACVREVFK